MNFLSYMRVELRRAFLSPKTWLVSILTLLAPLIGYGLYQPATQLAVTRSGEFMGNPTLAGAIGGVILFALLTLFELDRVHKSGTDRLTDTIVSPLTMYLTRMLSLLAAATATGILAFVIYLPYTLYKVGYLFDWITYFGCWFLIFLPALWIGCLISAVFYQLTRRFDLSLVLVIAAAIPCFTQAMQFDFVLRWINPDVLFMSDMFGNSLPLRMTAWSRLFWLVALAGLYILTLLGVRRYGKGLFGSFLLNSKCFYKPLLMVAVLLVLSVQLYVGQPFVNSSSASLEESSIFEIISERTPVEVRYTPGMPIVENLRLTKTYTLLEPDLNRGSVAGSTIWTFGGVYNAFAFDYNGMKGGWRSTRGYAVPLREEDDPFKMYFYINSGLTVRSLKINGEPAKFTVLPEEVGGMKYILFDMPYAEYIAVTVEYDGYFRIWLSDRRELVFGPVVSPRYFRLGSDLAGESTSYMEGLPPRLGSVFHSILLNPSDVYVIDVVLPAEFTLLNEPSWMTSVGDYVFYIVPQAALLSENGDGSRTWRFLSGRTEAPTLYAADYLHERIEMGETAIDFYYARKNLRSIEEYDAFATLRAVYEYCAAKIAPRPPADLLFIQALGPGEIQFSEAVLANQWQSVSGQGSYAYKLIGQWWSEMRFLPRRETGDEAVTSLIEKLLGDYNDPGWNINGVTEYMAYRFAVETYGREIADRSYVETWKRKTADYYGNFYVRNPEYLRLLSRAHADRLNQNKEDLLYLYTMPLKIWKAAQVVGEERMDEILAQLYQRAYYEKNNPVVPRAETTYEDFLKRMSLAGENRPSATADGYLSRLYMLAYGQSQLPSSEDFREELNLSRILRECGLEETDPLGILISTLYSKVADYYGNPPMIYYADFLEACGLTLGDLELTDQDFMQQKSLRYK